MDYEKLYNEALKRAKGICNVPDQDDITIARMEYLFPELKESDDEKIRKELIQLISCMHDKDPRKKDWLSWLEKQGDKKPTDKVEPKFHEGDWITDGDINLFQITKIDIDNEWYYADDGDRVCFDVVHDYYHLWTVADANDGDVLVDVYGNIGIFQKNDDFDWSSYCSLGPNGGFRCFAIEHELDGSHPADNFQRDILFKEMQEAGYEWDAEKKELKLLISNGGDFESNNSKQKPTWSENDDEYMSDVIAFLKDARDYRQNALDCIEWMKQLKERLS